MKATEGAALRGPALGEVGGDERQGDHDGRFRQTDPELVEGRGEAMQSLHTKPPVLSQSCPSQIARSSDRAGEGVVTVLVESQGMIEEKKKKQQQSRRERVVEHPQNQPQLFLSPTRSPLPPALPVGIFEGKRRVNLDLGKCDGSLGSLLSQLGKSLSIPTQDLKAVRAELWDNVFNDWVVVDDIHPQISMNAKLKLIKSFPMDGFALSSNGMSQVDGDLMGGIESMAAASVTQLRESLKHDTASAMEHCILKMREEVDAMIEKRFSAHYSPSSPSIPPDKSLEGRPPPKIHTEGAGGAAVLCFKPSMNDVLSTAMSGTANTTKKTAEKKGVSRHMLSFVRMKVQPAKSDKKKPAGVDANRSPPMSPAELKQLKKSRQIADALPKTATGKPQSG
jgi:hypothetical protein